MLSTPWAQRKNKYDFVIIGSGYGGAIAAARLATANLNPKPSVCILERGKERQPGKFPETLAGVIGAAAQLRQSAGPVRTADLSRHLGDQGIGAGRHVADQCQCGDCAGPGSVRAVSLAGGDHATPTLKPYYDKAREVLAPSQHPRAVQLAKVQALEPAGAGDGH